MMPDILIKNEVGEAVEYDGITSITVPTVGGSTATYTYGLPDPTLSREQFQEFINSGSTNYSVYSITFSGGRLYGSNMPSFGLWYVTDFDAVRVWDTGTYWGVFKEVSDGVIITPSSSSYSGMLFFDKEEHTVTQIYSGACYNPSWFSIPTGYIMAGGNFSKILRYNSTTHVVDELFSGRSSYTTSIEFSGVGRLFSFSSSTRYPIYFYDYSAQTLTNTGITGFYMGYKAAVTGGYLIYSTYSSSSYTCPICLFDTEAKTLTSVYEYYNSYYWYQYRFNTGTGLLMATTSSNTTRYAGILYYDFEAKTVTKVFASNYNWAYFHKIGQYVLCASTVGSTGIVVFDTSAKTASRTYSTGYGYSSFTDTDYGCVLYSGNYAGLLYFRTSDQSVTLFQSTGYWYYRCAVTGGLLYASQNSSYVGIYFMEESTLTVTQLWTTGYYWNIHRVTGGAFMGSPGYGAGLLFFDAAAKTITAKDSSYHYWTSFLDVTGGCFISNTNYGLAPRFYKESDGSLTTLDFTANQFNQKVDVTGGCLISSSNSYYGIWLYDNSTQTLTKIHTSGYRWNVKHVIDEGVLLSSDVGGYGVIFYDSNSKTITVLNTSGYNWNEIITVGSGYLLTGTSTYSPGIVYLNKTDKTGGQKYSSGWHWSETEWHTQGLKLYQKNAKFVKALVWDDTEHTIIEV